MQVILLERVEKLGQMGDVVKVKSGFARNFLLPRKKALRATKQNLELFETQRKQLEADNLERRQEAEKVAVQVEGRRVVIIRSAGESGQLYGSVTARDIAGALTEDGVTVGRNQVVMDRPIKTLGLHDMRVSLHPEVAVTVSVNVARSAEEAKRQAETGRAMTRADEEAAEAEAEAAAAAAKAAAAMLESAPVEDLVESATHALDDVEEEKQAEPAAESAAPEAEEAAAEAPAEPGDDAQEKA